MANESGQYRRYIRSTDRWRDLALKLNQLSLILLATPIVCTPLHSLKKMVVLVGMLGIWFLTTLAINRHWMRSCSRVPLLIAGFALLDLFYALGINDMNMFRMFFTHHLWVYIWLLIFCFYMHRPSLLRIPVAIMLVMLVVTCFLTISGNLVYPGASRWIAAGGARAEFYLSQGIAGYDVIYGLVFLTMPLIIAMHRKKLTPLLAIAGIALITVTLLIASYTLSLLIALGLLVCALANPKNKWKFVLMILLMVTLILIFRMEILNFIIGVGNDIDSNMLVRRATQIRDLTYFSDYGDSDYNRVVLYANGIRNFLKHPLIGRMGGIADGRLHSGHSALINYFDFFGVFGLLYVLFWRETYRLTKGCLASAECKNNYVIFFIFLMFFVSTDTVDTASAVGLCAVFLGPSMMLLADSTSRKTQLHSTH